jgi:RNA polymerase sigma factor (sigma-70 family)
MLTKLLKAAAAPVPRRERPPRAQVEPVAIDLVRRHGAEIMATARRYSSTREDAEDAYQRGLEILLTKAPSTHPDDLVPWLKTVVKHEAYSLHRQRERAGQPTAPERIGGAPATAPEDQAERLERLQIGAEALGRLKPQEIRCMLLLAEGHSYRQIQELTGFSYTKVNRCLAEGRRSFLRRVEGIESGEECERLAPLLSMLADGEASSRDLAVLRPHLRTCLSCRAALRDAREVPARVAALAPIGLVLEGHAAGSGLLGTLRSALDWLNERMASLALRGQDLIETASSHKLAAAAASAAALGGGGIATVEVSGVAHPGHGDRHTPRVVEPRPEPKRLPAPGWQPAAAVSAATTGGSSPRRARPDRSARVARPAGAIRHAPEPPAAARPAPRAPAAGTPPTAPLGAPEPASSGPTPSRHSPSSSASPEPVTGEFGP